MQEVYDYDKEREAERCFRTTDDAHPGVARLYAQKPHYLAGTVTVFQRPEPAFPELAFDPAETRFAFAKRGWKRVVGFQTRNPIHSAHEYLTKVALETVDGLLIHPLVGDTKSDDVPAATRVECYRVLVDGYYPQDRVLVSAFPAAMRYAGPREAVWHAICRKNYGCSHFIVGRDHAGVGDYYGTYDAQLIFDQFQPHELDIEPMFFEHSFFCRLCGSMASVEDVPARSADDHVFLSGTKVREMLAAGQLPPAEFSRPEVARGPDRGISDLMHRLADPYRDTDVIDSRAPRFNQATIGTLSLVAVLTGWNWLVGLLALQLVVGLVIGRRYCLPCLAYFELVQPRFGEGTLEDSRPPRAANIVGAVVCRGDARDTRSARTSRDGARTARQRPRAARGGDGLLHRL